MKGIILAGGKGTRLYPSTISVSKQLLPIYDKPLVYYPLSVLMLANIREVLVISTPEAIEGYRNLLGNGLRIGINIEYAVQESPRGLAEAFLIGETFIGSDDVCLALGDNVFYGQYFSWLLEQAKEKMGEGGAVIFGYPVLNPSEYGVVELDESNLVLSIEEKPANPKSNYAVPGLYFYNNDVIGIAKNVKPSERGELEITSINSEYLNRGRLHVILMGRGMVWFDTGSPKGMHKASGFVKTVQETQGFYISCIEEIAWRKGFIDDAQLYKLGEELRMTEYGNYILSLARGKER